MDKSIKYIAGVIVLIVIIGGIIALGRKDDNSEEVSKSEQQENKQQETSKESIKVGFIGPLTGDAAGIGQNAQAAVRIAVREINNSGGINGRPVEIIYEDGQCDGKTSVTAVNKLINSDKVVAVLGGACSSETTAIAGVTEPAKITTLSYCSSAPAITSAGDYIFRDSPSDLYQGSFAAEYAYNTLGAKKVAIMYSQSDYGKGIADVFVDTFEKLGGQVIAKEGFEDKVTDLRTPLTKVKAAQPDLIYYVSYTEAGILGIRQANELSIDIPMLGGDAWDDPAIWSAVGSAGNGNMYTVVSAPLSDEFKQKMREETNDDTITTCTPQAYDGLKLLGQVIAKAGTDSTDIKNALYNAVYTGGVSSSKISFDENGDIVGAQYVVKEVKDGVASEKK